MLGIHEAVTRVRAGIVLWWEGGRGIWPLWSSLEPTALHLVAECVFALLTLALPIPHPGLSPSLPNGGSLSRVWQRRWRGWGTGTSRSKAVGVSATPGFTKVMQEIHLDKTVSRALGGVVPSVGFGACVVVRSPLPTWPVAGS